MSVDSPHKSVGPPRFAPPGLAQSLESAYGAVNSVMFRTNWAIGKRIVEQEQAGADRAEYGTRVIQLLSEKLTNEYGKGLSATSVLNTISDFFNLNIKCR